MRVRRTGSSRSRGITGKATPPALRTWPGAWHHDTARRDALGEPRSRSIPHGRAPDMARCLAPGRVPVPGTGRRPAVAWLPVRARRPFWTLLAGALVTSLLLGAAPAAGRNSP